MAEARNVQLPDGRVVTIPADATPDQLAQFRDKLGKLARSQESPTKGMPKVPAAAQSELASQQPAVAAKMKPAGTSGILARHEAMEPPGIKNMTPEQRANMAQKVMTGETLAAGALGSIGAAPELATVVAPKMAQGATAGALFGTGEQAFQDIRRGELPSVNEIPRYLKSAGQGAAWGALAAPILDLFPFGSGPLGRIVGGASKMLKGEKGVAEAESTGAAAEPIIPKMSEGRPATWKGSYDDPGPLYNLARKGNRAAIEQLKLRGIPLPENVGLISGGPETLTEPQPTSRLILPWTK